ncbi:MAG: heme-copper oxidase subunit III [Candidatus Marinimicrobia bacterium]|nr:heme-copper oxidase subunit III [Candidatus Neomarinimicrobiota bacterium]
MKTLTTIKNIPKKNNDEFTAYIGMLIALGSFAMLFIALLASYAVLRVRGDLWMSNSIGMPSILIAWLNTGVISLSSYTYFLGSRSVNVKPTRILKKWLYTTIILGLFFLILQLTLWYILKNEGFTITSHQAGAVFYMLSGLHGLHVLVAIITLIWLFYQIRKLDNYSNPVKLVGMFWHFLTIVWMVIFLSVILI